MTIQSPNDRKNVYEKILCRACNNARTKPFDQAYQQFSEWVLAAAPILYRKQEINFVEVYGSDYLERGLNLLRYFAKSLGCRIAAAGIEPPKILKQNFTDLRSNDVKPLTVTFSINEFWQRIDPLGRILGDDHFNIWHHITERSCFSWVVTLGYLDICYWAVWTDSTSISPHAKLIMAE